MKMTEKQKKIQLQTQMNKVAFLKAYELLGGVNTACKNTGTSKSTYHAWYNRDDEFRQKIDEIRNTNVEAVEKVLLKKALSGDTSSIKFYLENNFPEKYGKKINIKINEKIEEIDHYTDEELEAKMKEYQARLNEYETDGEAMSD